MKEIKKYIHSDSLYLEDPNEKRRQYNKEYYQKRKNKSQNISNQTAIETVLDLIQKQQKELEKKDKIIDLMAKYIEKLDIDEDICMKNIANTDFCNENYTNCKDCIKRYFERKVR